MPRPKKAEDKETVPMRIDVDPDLKLRIKAVAARLNTTMSSLIERLSTSAESLEQLETELFGSQQGKDDDKQ